MILGHRNLIRSEFRDSHRFKKGFRTVPADVQKKAIKAFRFLASDPRHPSLGIKKIKGVKVIWEGLIDRSYRFTFLFEAEEGAGEMVCVVRNVDSQDEYL